MATKIIEIDTLSTPVLPDEGWPGYSSLLVLFRRGHRTLGARRLPLLDGRVNRVALDQAANDAVRSRTDLLVRERFGAVEPEQSSAVSISVIICTRDRASHLDRCLATLANCHPKPTEILVVDNASATRDTMKVAERHGVRCVREDRPGLNWARAKGARTARGEIVAYIDDDVNVSPTWLAPFARAFSDPSLAGLTGLVLPYALDDPASEMFEEYCGFIRGYKHRTFTISSLKPVGAANVGAGACMAFRRDLINQLRLFNIELDAGTAARTGGDTYAFYRLITLGYRIEYDPDVVVRHQHRDSESAVISTLRDYSIGTYVFFLHCFLRHREMHAFVAGMRWFRNHHLRHLFRRLIGRRQAQPIKLTLAEISGCFAAPGAYLRTRIRDRRPYPVSDESMESEANA